MADGDGASADGPFSTGNDFLDRRLDGGVRAGSIVALVAPPESQSQTILRTLAGTRRTLYLSTSCPDHDELRRSYLPPDADAVTAYGAPDSLLSSPGQYLDRIEPGSYVVVDPFTPVETTGDRAELLALLNVLKERLVETGSAAVLHCYRDSHRNPRTTTLDRVDDVWQLTPVFGSRQLAYRMLVTKSRGGRAREEPIPLVITDRVKIDTSWSI